MSGGGINLTEILGFSAVRMWYDIGTERLMCVTNVCVSSLIDKI